MDKKIGIKKRGIKKRELKKCIALMLIMAITVLNSFAVFADTLGDSELATYIASVSKVVNGEIRITDTKVDTWLHTSSKGIQDPKTIVVTVEDTTETFYMSQSERTSIERHIGSKKESGDVSGKVSDMVNNFNLEADTEAAGEMLSGFGGLARLLMGVVCYIVVISMGIFTSLDTAYIALPVFRNKCENAAQSYSGNSMVTKQDSSGESKVRWITDDAIYAVKTCSVESGKSPWGIYLKKRCMSYVMLAIVIYIMCTGRLDIIVRIALNLAKGVMSALSNLAV